MCKHHQVVNASPCQKLSKRRCILSFCLNRMWFTKQIRSNTFSHDTIIWATSYFEQCLFFQLPAWTTVLTSLAKPLSFRSIAQERLTHITANRRKKSEGISCIASWKHWRNFHAANVVASDTRLFAARASFFHLMTVLLFLVISSQSAQCVWDISPHAPFVLFTLPLH